MAPKTELNAAKAEAKTKGILAEELQDKVKTLSSSLAESQTALKTTKDALASALARLEDMVPKSDLAAAKSDAKIKADLADELQDEVKILSDSLADKNEQLLSAKEALAAALAKLENMAPKVDLNAARSDAKIKGDLVGTWVFLRLLSGVNVRVLACTWAFVLYGQCACQDPGNGTRSTSERSNLTASSKYIVFL